MYLSQSIKAQFNGDEIKNDLSLKRTKEIINSLQININRKVSNYYNDLLKLSLKNYNNKHKDNVKLTYITYVLVQTITRIILRIIISKEKNYLNLRFQLS